QRNAPFQARARPADRQILQRLAQEAEDLVAIALRTNHVRPALDLLDQPRLILGHLEEVVLFLDPGERREVIGTLAVDDFLFGVEPLAAEAVVTAVASEIDLAGLPERLQDLLHDLLVPRLGGADEVVIADAEPAPGLTERRRDALGVGLRRDPGLGRRLGAFVAVLVRSGQEPHAIAGQAVPPRHRIADDRGVGVAEMRLGVDVVDRRRQIEDAVAHAGGCSCTGRTWSRPSQVSWLSGTS